MVYKSIRKPFVVVERTVNRTLDSGEEVYISSEELIKAFEEYEQALNCMKKVKASEVIMIKEEIRQTRHAKGYTERIIYDMRTKRELIRATVEEWETYPQKGEE